MAQVIGQYQGKDITAGTDAEVAAQMAKIRAIPAQDIQAVSPVAVPPVVDSAGQAVLSEVPQEAAQQRATDEADRQEYLAQQQQKQVDTEREELMAKVSDATDIMRSVPQREEEAGLPAERLAAAEIASQIEARELRLRREIENLEKRGGMSASAMQSTINRMQTEAAREIADLSIVQNAKLRRIDALETSIDRRIKLELAPLELELQFDKMFYEENREQLSKTQDRAFQLRIAQEEREYQEQMMVKQQIGQVAETAARYGANATQIGQITSAKTWDEAIASGSKFLGAGFALQMEQFRFSQWATNRQMQLAEESAERQMLKEADEMNLKVGAAFTSDERVKQYEIANQAYNRFNSIATDREISTFENISGNNAEERALATAYIRMTQPDISRSADAGDINATQQLDELVSSTLRGLRADKATLPRKLREMAIAADKLYNASLIGLESATNDFNSRLISGVELPNVRNWENVKSSSISDSILTARRENHSDSSILNYLESDPLLGNQIKSARGQFSDSQIIQYLLSL